MVAIFEIQPTADIIEDPTGPVRQVSPSPRAPARPSAGRSHVLRTVLLGTALVALLFAGLLTASLLSGPAAPVEAAGEFHVVSEGDTLYSVASSWNSQAPVADVIEQISALNGGLDSVAVGDVISLPSAVR